MSQSTPGFDYHRYRQLLAEATDEPRRLELIRILTDEGAKAKLAAQPRPARRPLKPATGDA